MKKVIKTLRGCLKGCCYDECPNVGIAELWTGKEVNGEATNREVGDKCLGSQFNGNCPLYEIITGKGFEDVVEKIVGVEDTKGNI
ncbi:MAG: hypothetical protein LBH47_01995 [Christensenellaceae bacterium]|jgi:hypothetical protein|nr:hypothetical protein [Christensenellaceae bacterium]